LFKILTSGTKAIAFNMDSSYCNQTLIWQYLVHCNLNSISELFSIVQSIVVDNDVFFCSIKFEHNLDCHWNHFSILKFPSKYVEVVHCNKLICRYCNYKINLSLKMAKKWAETCGLLNKNFCVVSLFILRNNYCPGFLLLYFIYFFCEESNTRTW